MKSSPIKSIILFFIVLILVGTALLCLPSARSNNAVFSFLTCLFTATSAVCVTGLSVVDIGSYYSYFGQIVILCLVQVGAFGYMLVSTGLGVLLGRMALKDRQIMKEIFDISSFDDLFKLLKKAIILVLSIELLGAIAFTASFIKQYSFVKAVYLGIFYSITSFCNAGFSIFSNSFENFAQMPAVLYTSAILILLGGFGFFVLVDIIDKIIGKNIRLTFHSKIVLWLSFFLVLVGFLIILVNTYFALPNNYSFLDVLNNSFFQAVSARTAGFNSMPMGFMTSFSIFVIILLMFIGGGPGSTAGGLKVTNLVLLWVFVKNTLKGNENFPFINKNIDEDLVKKAVVIFVLMVFLIMFFIMILLITESHLPATKVIFETISGFCTVGLSLGVTQQFTQIGKIILVIAMLVGRIGAVSILVYLVNRTVVPTNIKYPDGKIFIG